MSQPFELVNLAASLANNTPSVHESSDDGLDPYEFISQEDAKPSKSKRKSKSPDRTLTVRKSELENNSCYIADTLSASKLVESFASFGSLPIQSSHERTDNSSESPQVFLQDRNEVLQKELKLLIKNHKILLSEGASCTSIRQEIRRQLSLLSENNMQLHEVYSRELGLTDAFLKKLERWDQKRNGVLGKIKLIKSSENEFGTKLQGLLNQRDEVDSELEALHRRSEVLISKRKALNSEIGETVSVLESRSAKYVSLFRTLEQKGTEAVLLYLAQDTSMNESARSLVRAVPVNSCFFSLNKTTSEQRVASQGVKAPDISLRPRKARQEKLSSKSSSDRNAEIGMVPYDAPVSKFTGNASTSISTPYELGYSTGAEQIERMKVGFNSFIHRIFSQHERKQKPSLLDDELNIITEMMDLDPIMHVLSSKSEALGDFLIRTSKLSESYHKDSLEWSDVCMYLEAQEDRAYEAISATGDPESMVSTLKESFGFLSMRAHNRVTLSTKDREKNYTTALLRNECLNVAVALSTILGDSSYVGQLDYLNFLRSEVCPVDNRNLLDSRITSAGNEQPENERHQTRNSQKPKKAQKIFPTASNKAAKKE